MPEPHKQEASYCNRPDPGTSARGLTRSNRQEVPDKGA